MGIVVAAGDGPSLFGCDWLNHIKFDWREVKAITNHAEGSLDFIFDKHGDIFNDEMGTINIKTLNSKLYVYPRVNPKFFKPRTVPYAIKKKN